MSQEDRERWDAKHSKARGTSLDPADPLVLEALRKAELPPRARLLDLACGRGRHALEFARRGFDVSAWDVSEEALLEVSRSAAAEALTVRTQRVDIDRLGVVESTDSFDLVCVVNFLDRTLPQRVGPLLAPGGALLLCTFTDDHPAVHPSARHRLRSGELEAGWSGYSSTYYAEREGRAVLLANVVDRGTS